MYYIVNKYMPKAGYYNEQGGSYDQSKGISFKYWLSAYWYVLVNDLSYAWKIKIVKAK